MDTLALHNALAAVCPIDGISVGNPADKTTWRIDFDPSATADQQKAAQVVVANFDASKPPAIPPTPRQWLERLSPATQAGIFTAAVGNPTLLGWLFKASGNPSIEVASQEVKDGVATLVAAGVLTPADQTTLLAP